MWPGAMALTSEQLCPLRYSREHAEQNAFYEAMRHTGVEVLFVTDVVDELVLFHLQRCVITIPDFDQSDVNQMQLPRQTDHVRRELVQDTGGRQVGGEER